MSLPFILPPITEDAITPIWQGDKFQVGTEFTKVLQYSTNNEGWNDSLTHFHEESAGEQHFIDCASRDHAIQQLKTHIKEDNAIILEIGCSSGFMLKKIQQTFPRSTTIGADIVSEPLQKLADTLPGTPLLRFDLIHCPLPDNSVDAVVILNVLEHIENEAAAVKQIFRILKPGGIAIIEVPAGPDLYDIYDKLMMHYRRYTLSRLTALVKNQGFSIIKKSHLGFFLYPGFWLIKKRNKKLLSKPDTMQRQKIQKEISETGENWFMHYLMQIELFLGRFIRYPVGIRCLITCRK